MQRRASWLYHCHDWKDLFKTASLLLAVTVGRLSDPVCFFICADVKQSLFKARSLLEILLWGNGKSIIHYMFYNDFLKAYDLTSVAPRHQHKITPCLQFALILQMRNSTHNQLYIWKDLREKNFCIKDFELSHLKKGQLHF